MNWGKLDASLAAALHGSPGPFVVYVALAGDPDDAGAALLRTLGMADPPAGPAVVTLTAGRREIADLSERPWVRAVHLARRLDLL